MVKDKEEDEVKTTGAGMYLVTTLVIIYLLFSHTMSTMSIYVFLGFLDAVGALLFLKPKSSIGKYLYRALQRMGENQQRDNINQRQTKPKNSPQSNAGRDVNIYYGNRPSKDEEE